MNKKIISLCLTAFVTMSLFTVNVFAAAPTVSVTSSVDQGSTTIISGTGTAGDKVTIEIFDANGILKQIEPDVTVDSSGKYSQTINFSNTDYWGTGNYTVKVADSTTSTVTSPAAVSIVTPSGGGSTSGGSSSGGSSSGSTKYTQTNSSSDDITLIDITGHWAQSYIQKLVDKDIITGYAEGGDNYSYRPENNITRAEFAKIIALASKLDVTSVNVASMPFVDADSIADWCKPYIMAAYNAGIIKGREVDGGVEFNADANITRAEMATMIGRSIKVDGTKELTFADKDAIPEWAVPYVKASVENQIINGYEDNTFGPSNYATRAETAKMVVQMLELPWMK